MLPIPILARQRIMSPETLGCIFFRWWCQKGACVPGAGEVWVLMGNSNLLLPFCALWRVRLLVLRCLLHITLLLPQMLPLFSLLSSLWRNLKKICIMHLPRRPNKYFNSCCVLYHLQPAFFYCCLLTPACPPWSLSPAPMLGPMACATTSVKSFNPQGAVLAQLQLILMLSTFLHWFSSCLSCYYFFDFLLVFFPRADSNVFLFMLYVYV